MEDEETNLATYQNVVAKRRFVPTPRQRPSGILKRKASLNALKLRLAHSSKNVTRPLAKYRDHRTSNHGNLTAASDRSKQPQQVITTSDRSNEPQQGTAAI
ncbi:hypothetical protein G6F61_013236 [Rhizopus arrhizus]|nr:hypothetical protein G6F66_014193 [Rhizopus arrhizus]KAG1366200.1 hypothetical protein G6F61_013236 [Rhizopus arrhizus]